MTSAWPRLRCGWWLLCWLLSACTESPGTGVLVSIHADERVAQRLNRLQVLLYALEERDESRPVEDRPFQLGAVQGEVALPFSFLIQKGKAQRFRLVVKGYRAGDSEPLIERKVIASFRDGHTELLRVVLADVCYDPAEPCLALDQTCYPLQSEEFAAGECGPVPEVNTERVRARTELDATIEKSQGRDADSELDPEVDRDAERGLDAEGSLFDAGAVASNPLDADESPRDTRDAGTIKPDAREPPPDNGDGGANPFDAATGTDGCAPGQVSNGAGGCVPDPCLPQPCQHGGRCAVAAGAFRCDCAGTGFEGPTCGSNSNECNGANVCAGTRNGIMFSYPCRDQSGEQVGYSCPGMFSEWPLATPPNRFTESRPGVIRDARTGLEWQRAIDALDRTLADARSYCVNLPLAGARFRLPTRAELDTITDVTVSEPSAIDQLAFPGTPGLMFWTSSAHVGEAGSHWVVHFYNGSFHSQPSATAAVRVRCVRLQEGP